ncbi:MAG: hypothetical protein ACRDWT_07140, partial [Jatrophihabitantaceae bacterium]
PAASTPVAPAAVPEPALVNDTFAGLPRLRPFTDFELDPIGPTPDPPPDYSGRRRSDSPPPRRSRHGAEDDVEAGGRRRRRAEADSDDVLSRILQRENAR